MSMIVTRSSHWYAKFVRRMILVPRVHVRTVVVQVHALRWSRLKRGPHRRLAKIVVAVVNLVSIHGLI